MELPQQLNPHLAKKLKDKEVIRREERILLVALIAETQPEVEADRKTRTSIKTWRTILS